MVVKSTICGIYGNVISDVAIFCVFASVAVLFNKSLCIIIEGSNMGAEISNKRSLRGNLRLVFEQHKAQNKSGAQWRRLGVPVPDLCKQK